MNLAGGSLSPSLTWEEFRTNFLDKGLVEKITVVNKTTARVTLRRDSGVQAYGGTPYVSFTIGSVDSFERKLDEAQNELGIPATERIPVQYTQEGSLLSSILAFLPTILLIGGIMYITRRGASGLGGSGGLLVLENPRPNCSTKKQILKLSSKTLLVWMKLKSKSWNL